MSNYAHEHKLVEYRAQALSEVQREKIFNTGLKSDKQVIMICEDPKCDYVIIYSNRRSGLPGNVTELPVSEDKMLRINHMRV